MRVLLFSLAVREALGACHDITDCASCLAHKTLFVHDCYFCGVDLACHEVGSAVSPCTPSMADDQCISRASLSHCASNDADMCSAMTGLDPKQIHIAVAGRTGMRVAWKTEASTTCQLSAQTGVTTVAGVTERVKNYLEGYGYHHVAMLRDLLPGATYQYTISCGGHSSTPRSFEVAPSDLTSYTALVVADMGYGQKGNAEQSRRMMEELKESTRLTIHAGDVGYADDSYYHALDPCNGEFCYEAVYDKYMGWIENMTDNKPYMVGPGNHEAECHSPYCLGSTSHREALSNFSAYNTRWAMPSSESKGVLNMWYSFDYGSVHYVAANTETDYDSAPEQGKGPISPSGSFAPSGGYLEWLEADLRAANENRQETPWIVVFGHRTWLQNAADGCDTEVGTAHADLFEKYGVDLYIAGHKHAYHRFLPLSGNSGTPIVVTGGAGCDEGHSNIPDIKGTANDWDYFTLASDYEVGTLEVTPSKLVWKAYNSRTGEVFDTFDLAVKTSVVV